MPYSQNGYPAGNSALVNAAAVIPGTDVDFPGGVRKGAVEIVVMYVAAQVRKRVEPTTGYGCWGYAYRDIRGSSGLSNHASGTAIDYNAPQHPLGVRGTWSAAERNAVHAILREVDNVIRWGDDYSGRVDGMHFEVNAPLAAVERVAARIRGGAAVGKPKLVIGSRGGLVSHAQKLVWARLTPDRLERLRRDHGGLRPGIYDRTMAEFIRVFGAQNGINNGGELGRRTWGWLDPPELRLGSQGSAVRTVQIWLNNRAPAGPRLEPDGAYGPLTRNAVVAYQKYQRIPGGGGVVGFRTWNAFFRGSYHV